ncbi:MAG: AAA family ATPase [Clostridia bacterium]|nr:AAA family ATPase [Clostridia bacterium]
MGIPVLILGESGSGKSCSLRNFEKENVVIYNIAGKPLPFKKQLNKADNVNYTQIKSNMQKGNFKTYVIDDSQYLMAFEMFDRAKELGYNKFTDVALNFRGLVDFVIKNTPADTIVYFLHHTETTDTGKVKAKTSGKMLDNQLTLEGLFSIVLLCKTDGQEHYFETQSDGYSTCKSPMGMFDLKIDNDLKMVDDKIREYYELNKKEAKPNESTKKNTKTTTNETAQKSTQQS